MGDDAFFYDDMSCCCSRGREDENERRQERTEREASGSNRKQIERRNKCRKRLRLPCTRPSSSHSPCLLSVLKTLPNGERERVSRSWPRAKGYLRYYMACTTHFTSTFSATFCQNHVHQFAIFVEQLNRTQEPGLLARDQDVG